jgi:hypothetical protein
MHQCARARVHACINVRVRPCVRAACVRASGAARVRDVHALGPISAFLRLRTRDCSLLWRRHCLTRFVDQLAPSRALKDLEQSLAVYREMGDRHARTHCMRSLARPRPSRPRVRAHAGGCRSVSPQAVDPDGP